MTVEFPAPAASEQPGLPAQTTFPATAAAAPPTTYPVYDPTTTSQHGQHPMVPPHEPAANPTGGVFAPSQTGDAKQPTNPLGEYHKVAQQEPGNERELLFTIGGKPLYAPHADDVDPAIGFRMIRDLRKFGVPYAVANAFGDLLGDEALDLLADAPKMSKDDWAQIMSVLQEKVFSRMADLMPGGKD